ncbi:MAG: hypothetical protein P9L94_13245 [Candidatus Hinthialibacter antarcticus]|nr:hypothetical protein [Candidatus Hinthialibacter antarcticus]
MIEEIIQKFKLEFEKRKFFAGLLISIIDFVQYLKSVEPDFSSFNSMIERFPKVENTSTGKKANTLIVQLDDKTISLRPFYNTVESLIRSEHKRFDYPSCAPHATQAWSDYVDYFDDVCRLPRKKLVELRSEIIDHVLLELPDQSYNPEDADNIVHSFKLLLEKFEFKAPPSEPTGASFQGAIFGFIRADNPHLQVEIDKVRTGSKRLQRVGDIDAWDGQRLAISAEVKSYELKKKQLAAFSNFANEINKRASIGLVVAPNFEINSKQAFLDMGLKPLSLADLIQIVSLWDPSKQRIAVESMIYYACHVEKNSTLINRLNEFVKKIRD